MQSIENLLLQGRDAAEYATEVLGYDQARFDGLSINSDGQVNWRFYLYDDFQKHLDLKDQYKVNYVVANTPLLNWPNRERRELEVLIRQTRRITELSDNKLVGLEALAFVEKIKQDAESFYAQLEDKRIGEQATVEADAPDQTF